MINKEDLIEGNYYFTVQKLPFCSCVFKYQSTGYVLYLSNKGFSENRYIKTFPGILPPDREATSQEINHYLQCLENGKYVEYTEPILSDTQQELFNLINESKKLNNM